jgi:hypothetical protein
LLGCGSPQADTEKSQVNSMQFKLVSATFGAGALVAMGVFAAASSGASAAGPQQVSPLPQKVATNETTPPDVVATPPITTAPFTIPTGEPQ